MIEEWLGRPENSGAITSTWTNGKTPDPVHAGQSAALERYRVLWKTREVKTEPAPAYAAPGGSGSVGSGCRA